jgi:ABC-2 type transport system ATP-binding protein
MFTRRVHGARCEYLYPFAERRMPVGRGPGAAGRKEEPVVLEVRSLSKRYDDVVALDGVSLSVERGELLGFLGPNGAGKTTTMRAILGVVSLDGGEIRWDGSPMTPEIRGRIGYMPAERGMYPKMRVREEVVYFARLTGMYRRDAGRAADRWLERLGLSGRNESEVQALSSGNQQRVQLALALVNDPELLVLDEPFAGLDPLATDVLKEVLVERVEAGAALLFSSHQLDLVEEVSRNVVIIDQGRIVLAGDVGDLRRSSPHRYVDLSFAAEVSWAPAIGTVVVKEPRRVVVQVAPDVDLQRILADAQAQAPLASFSFEPPALSEVFLAAVGRSVVETQAQQEDAP